MITTLCKRQGDLAREPLVAPIKMHRTPQLAYNYLFYHARAEPPVGGRRDGRPTELNPAQTEPAVCRTRPRDFNAAIRRR